MLLLYGISVCSSSRLSSSCKISKSCPIHISHSHLLPIGDSPPEGKENGGPENQPSANGYPAPPTRPGPAQAHTSQLRGQKRERAEGLAALLDSPDLPSGRTGPYGLRRHLGPNKPITQREPSLAHLAASNSADLGTVNHIQNGHTESTQKEQPVQAAAISPKARAPAPPAQPQQPFAGFALSSSAGSDQAQSAPSEQTRFLSPFSQPNTSGHDPMDAFAHLPEGLRIQLQAPGAEDMSRTNSLVYNQASCSMYMSPLSVFCNPNSA